MLPKLKLKTKIVIIFILVFTIPLAINNLIWFNVARSEVIEGSSTQVRDVTNQALEEVNNFLANKLSSLVINSQNQALYQQNISVIAQQLQKFLAQDEDAEEFTLLKDGKELTRVDRNRIYNSQTLQNQIENPTYKAITSSGQAKYIGSVTNENGKSMMVMAIPVLGMDKSVSLQQLMNPSFNLSRQFSVTGIYLVEKINLTSLWKDITSLRIARHGNSYIVDANGNVLAHIAEISGTPTNLRGVPEVDSFLHSLTNESDTSGEIKQSRDENGNLALTTHARVSLTNWGIISHLPINDILSSLNSIEIFALLLLGVMLITVGFLSLSIANRILRPVEILSEGSRLIGNGNFAYRISVKTGDEIEELANSYNKMAESLQNAFEKVKEDKNIILGERNQMKLTLSNTADAVVAIDTNRRVTLFNKASEQLTGFTESQVLGKMISQVIHLYLSNEEIFMKQYLGLDVPSLEEGIVFNQKHVRLQGWGRKEAFVNVIVEKINPVIGSNLGYILTLHDVSEELQLEEMKLDFVSIAAHELRTPLTAIKGYLSVFFDENKATITQDQQLLLSHVKVATQRLGALIENLLSITHIEKGMVTLNILPIEWIALCQQIVNDMQAQAAEKQITLTLKKPLESSMFAAADKLRVSEVLSNLIANAINYTPTKGSVTVSLEKKDGMVVTHVTDTGMGMSKEAMGGLFTKFYRVRSKLTQGAKGTGLGLFISKSIIEMHKGQIWVTSEEGKGSAFGFSLPIAEG